MNTMTSGGNSTNVDHPTIGGQAAAAVNASQVDKTMKTSMMKKSVDAAVAKEGRAQVEKQSSDNGHDDHHQQNSSNNKHEEKKQTSTKRRRCNSPHRPRKHHIPREAPRLVQSPDEYACITDDYDDESSKTYYDYLPYEVRRDIDRLCPKLTLETHPSSFVIVHPKDNRPINRNQAATTWNL
jgi:hypothetical protein